MKQIYAFAEGNMEMRALLGGKGANLAEMTNLGLPVPPGFTLTTAACHDYQQHHGLSEALLTELDQHIQALEKATGKRFDDPVAPITGVGSFRCTDFNARHDGYHFEHRLK